MKTALIALGITLAGALATAAPAGAQGGYPTRPINLVVPFPPGGATDVLGRVIAQKLGQELGQTVVVENRAGAGTVIGAGYVAKAAPDGYTLLLDASGPLVVNPSLYKKTPYDPLKDFAPISQITSYQYALVVPQQSPAHSIDDLLAAARKKPGAVTYGSAGLGAGGHLAGELLALRTGTQLTHVPYKGNAQALTDVLGGQLSFTFDTTVTATPHIQSGKLRAYAVTGPRRASSLPDLPTMQELGYKDFVITQFQGLLAPAGTDPRIIATLHDAVVQAVKDPEVVRKLATEGGNEIIAGTPEEFTRQLRDDLQRYRQLISQAHITAE